MRKILTLVFCSLMGMAYSQMAINKCAFNEINQFHARHNPAYKNIIDATFHTALAYSRTQGKRNSDSVYRIPVVVHIVYNKPQENLHDSLVYNQIEVLNQDYRRKNADTSNLRPLFNGLGADAGIEFYLACTDPDGNPTTGITRTQTNRTSFGNFLGMGVDEVKFDSTGGKSGWDYNRYLNIWVCNTGGAVLGLAYPPMGAPNWPSNAFPADPRLQGVVVHYEVFGKNNPLATGPYAIADQGRTLVHEIGHYLGLRHIWGDGPLSLLGIPDCTVDDGIADTPNSGTNSQIEGCAPSKNTCNDGPGDLPDMWENYMDYSEERCQNIFTQGQINIMRAMIATARSALLQPQCSDTTSNDTTSSSTALYFKKSAVHTKLYPNPATHNLKIEVSSNPSAISSVQLISLLDITGKCRSTFQPNNSFTTAHLQQTLDISMLPAGIYFVKLTFANGFSESLKFIKQ
jgi:hypothetical protein